MKKLYLLLILFPIVCNAIDTKPLHTILLDNKQICRNVDSVYKESDLFYIVQCDNIAGKYIVNRGNNSVQYDLDAEDINSIYRDIIKNIIKANEQCSSIKQLWLDNKSIFNVVCTEGKYLFDEFNKKSITRL